jgi:hypothetical protein
LFGVCKVKVLYGFSRVRKVAASDHWLRHVFCRPYGTTVLPLGGLFLKFHILDSVKVYVENQVG